jgi:hypothetical protein
MWIERPEYESAMADFVATGYSAATSVERRSIGNPHQVSIGQPGLPIHPSSATTGSSCASGRRTVKVLPTPSVLATSIVPPWRATISFTT